VCGTVWCGFGGVILCCLWDCLLWVCGCECVLCAVFGTVCCGFG